MFSRLTPVSLHLFPEPLLLSCCHSHSGCVVGGFGSAGRAPRSPSHVCATASLKEVCWASARYSAETSSLCLRFYRRCSCQQEIIITVFEKLQLAVNNSRPVVGVRRWKRLKKKCIDSPFGSSIRNFFKH